MFELYNPNPVNTKGRIGDCAVRAVAKALDTSWEEAYTRLSLNGFLMGDMPSSDIVIGSVLRKEGFKKEFLPNTCPDCYTVEKFCEDYPEGVYVIKSSGHMATVVDGILYDAWDSSGNVPIYMWSYREEDD